MPIFIKRGSRLALLADNQQRNYEPGTESLVVEPIDKSIEIIDGYIISSKKIKYQKVFNFNLSLVEIVSVTKAIYFDVEETFLTFVLGTGELNHVYLDHIDNEFIINFEKIFKVKLEWRSWSDQHGSGYSEIIFPSEFQGENLYRRNLSGIHPFVLTLMKIVNLKPISDGIVRRKFLNYMKEKN